MAQPVRGRMDPGEGRRHLEPITSLEKVEAILGRLSRQPLLPDRVVLVLPRNEAQCTKRRQLLRELAQRGWSQESLLRITGCYTPEVLAEITRGAAPTSKVSARRKSRSKLDPKRFCPCGCKKRLKGRQKYASDACRKKVTRQRTRIVA